MVPFLPLHSQDIAGEWGQLGKWGKGKGQSRVDSTIIPKNTYFSNFDPNFKTQLYPGN